MRKFINKDEMCKDIKEYIKAYLHEGYELLYLDDEETSEEEFINSIEEFKDYENQIGCLAYDTDDDLLYAYREGCSDGDYVGGSEHENCEDPFEDTLFRYNKSLQKDIDVAADNRKEFIKGLKRGFFFGAGISLVTSLIVRRSR